MFKVTVVALTFIFAFFIPVSGLALVKLIDVQAERLPSGIEALLTFDKPIKAQSFTPEFERNFIQVVLKSTTLDAARIILVSESQVQKVFVYPYTPDVTRLRIILKQDHNWAKGKVSLVNKSQKTLRLFVVDPKVSAVKESGGNNNDPKEAILLKEVLNKTKDIDIQNPDSVKLALQKNPTTPPVSAVAKDTSIGIKVDPTRHFARMAIVLSGLIALLIGLVFLIKKYAPKLKKLPFGKKERLIQVVATHYMGHKKSISLVKITGEYMVVGVSNDGISLITKLGPEINVDKYLEDRFWGGTFEKHLKTYEKYDGAKDLNPKPSPVNEEISIPNQPTIRSSIKEKLTSLKPLV